MAAIHRKGYVIGDVNYKNALFNDHALITVVDCDSMQVTDAQNIVHRCLVGIPEYTSPELQGLDFAKVTRTFNHDAFGLAVLTFQLLMQGFHPFAGRPLPGAPDVDQVHIYSLSKKIFPYLTNNLFAPPVAAPPIGALPAVLQNLFRQAFTDTPSLTRPTPKEWASALEMVESRLVECSNNPDHWYPSDGVCVICEVDYNVGRRKRPASAPNQPTVQMQVPLSISTPTTPTQPVTNQPTLSMQSSNLSTSTCTIHWFRRDLRIADNPALTTASQRGSHGMSTSDPHHILILANERGILHHTINTLSYTVIIFGS
jgi:DNA-binding helix-hairpin-helix protein with protein kinase domain